MTDFPVETAEQWFARFPDLAKAPVFTLRVRLPVKGSVYIRAYEGPVCSRYGHTRLFCELSSFNPAGMGLWTKLFPRSDFYVGIPSHQCIDSDDAKECVLSLFALKPGDTDDEFFEHYTPEQLAFVEENGEWLSYVAGERYGER